MLKMALIVAPTALLAFGAGIWTKATILTAAATPSAVSIEPLAMHLKVNPQELPVQHIDNYN